jgi:hypothetical protein
MRNDEDEKGRADGDDIYQTVGMKKETTIARVNRIEDGSRTPRTKTIGLRRAWPGLSQGWTLWLD